MRNFIAVQTFAWGKGTQPPAVEAQYEIRAFDGDQKFREYPDGKKLFEYAPFPPVSTSVTPGAEWSELLTLVGTNRNLKVRRADDAIVNGRRTRIFQYRGEVEDQVCGLRTVLDFGFISFTRKRTYACYGEVWTDEDMNILRMSENIVVNGRWHDPRIVLTYGWLSEAGACPIEPHLVPLTLALEIMDKSTPYWCRGQFTDYHMFLVRSRIVKRETPGAIDAANDNGITPEPSGLP
jgi:hypothetical protein